MLGGRTVNRHPSSIARHPLHLYTSLHGVLGGLAGVQVSMDSKKKMCPFQATTSMQSGTHQVQGEGMTDSQTAAWREDTDSKRAWLAGDD